MSIVTGLPSERRVAVPTSIPHYCTSLWNRLSDFYWERRLGIRTQGRADSPHCDAHAYGYLSYHTYFSILDRLQLTSSDVVVDLGCGKGRVVCAAALYDVREAIGVEIDPHLAAAATANVARMRGRRTAARIVGGSAVDFDFDPVTAIVLFHPFGVETMDRVLDRLHESLVRRPRVLRIAYANPEFTAVPAARTWLERYENWNPGRWSRTKFPVHFYRSRT